MSLKLKDFITQLRGCKTTREEKEFILKETASIRQSFQKNEMNYKPRNLVKLLFINLQGFDCDFGQIESLNLACRTSFIEKRIGYLTMSCFLHEKSEMLMMATNRIALDLDHFNPFVREIALSAFTAIADQDMARTLAPKIKAILIQNNETRSLSGLTQPGYASAFRNDDASLGQLVRKKAYLAVLKIVQKCPDLLLEFLPLFNQVYREKDHGLLLSAVPLLERFYTLIFEQMNKETCGNHLEDNPELSKNQLVTRFLSELNDNVTGLVDRVKSLLSYSDPDYLANGVNDPFLLISILQLLRQTILRAEQSDISIDPAVYRTIQGLVVFVLANTKQNKKSVHAVLFELAQLALVFPDHEEMVAAAFAILIQLLESKEQVPNLKFVALKLVQTAGNSNDRFLSLVGSQCELILDVLKEEDASLRALSLKVLPLISSPDNADKLYDAMRDILMVESCRTRPNLELENAVVNNVFHMFEHKFADRKAERVRKSVQFLLVCRCEIAESHIASLNLLIANSDELQTLALPLLWSSLLDNWDSAGLFRVACYLLGECADSLIPAGLDPIAVLLFLDKIRSRVIGNINKGYFITCVAKIIAKNSSNDSFHPYLSIIRSFLRDLDSSVQTRAAELIAILETPLLSPSQKAELFAAIPSSNLCTNGPSSKRPTLAKRKRIVMPLQSARRADDLLDVDFHGLKPQLSATHEELNTIISDDEMQVVLRWKNEGGSFNGKLEVISRASQPLVQLVVQIIGISNAIVLFPGVKWNEVGKGEQKEAEFSVNRVDVSSKDVKLKVLVKFFPSNVEQSDDFRIQKEGSVVLRVKDTVSSSLDMLDHSAVHSQTKPRTPVNIKHGNDLLDLDLF